MKRFLVYILFCFAISGNLYYSIAQSNVMNVNLPGTPAEKINLITDRSLYCVDEKMNFSAQYYCMDEITDYRWSNILYVELIRWNGDKIVQSKFQLKGNYISGFIVIPHNLESGNYYLRAYTHWMRNYSNSIYSYALVKIVNPYMPVIDKGPEKATNNKHGSGMELEFDNKINGVKIISKADKFYTRQKVDLDILLDNKSIKKTDQFCISVSKLGMVDTSYSIMYDKPEFINNENIKYLPEIRGASVSGIVVDRVTQQPLKNVLVQLCIPVSGKYFSVDNTNEKGEFYFTIPYINGKYDFYIDVKSNYSTDAEILINNDYCNEDIILPYISFKLEKDEENLIKEVMVDNQLKEKFLSAKESSYNVLSDYDTLKFYGSAEKIYYTKEYIELPNLAEFFYEIVSEVMVVYNKDSNYLKITNNTNFQALSPLILIDNLPVYNVAKFLKTSLKKIERVEVINSRYIAGNSIYNGLISVYSKNKDFAGVELNPNSMFFGYKLCDPLLKDVLIKNTDSNPRIPDKRDMLLWLPETDLSPGVKKTISFNTSDNKGTYIVYIRNYNSGSGSVYGSFIFNVE